MNNEIHPLEMNHRWEVARGNFMYHVDGAKSYDIDMGMGQAEDVRTTIYRIRNRAKELQREDMEKEIEEYLTTVVEKELAFLEELRTHYKGAFQGITERSEASGLEEYQDLTHRVDEHIAEVHSRTPAESKLLTNCDFWIARADLMDSALQERLDILHLQEVDEEYGLLEEKFLGTLHRYKQFSDGKSYTLEEIEPEAEKFAAAARRFDEPDKIIGLFSDFMGKWVDAYEQGGNRHPWADQTLIDYIAYAYRNRETNDPAEILQGLFFPEVDDEVNYHMASSKGVWRNHPFEELKEYAKDFLKSADAFGKAIADGSKLKDAEEAAKTATELGIAKDMQDFRRN